MMSESLDWAEDNPKMVELADYEKELEEERKTLVEKPCVCGAHRFSIDEKQMGSVCPECFTDSEGKKTLSVSEMRAKGKRAQTNANSHS